MSKKTLLNKALTIFVLGTTFVTSAVTTSARATIISAGQSCAPSTAPMITLKPSAPVVTVKPIKPVSTPVATVKPVPTVRPTSTPVPTVKPVPTVRPTSTPVPTVKPTNAPVATQKPSTETQSGFEAEVLRLVNVERANYGLAPLTMHAKASEVAKIKAVDMYENRYFDHTSPTYGTPFEMLKSFGISYKAAAENIAQGFTSPAAVVRGWMNSDGHRKNILNSKYTQIGIGYESKGNNWVQLFIG